MEGGGVAASGGRGRGRKRRASRDAGDGRSAPRSDADDDEADDGEDLMGDNMVDDYQEMAALDVYDERMLDEREYSEDRDARREADARMDERDRRRGVQRGGRLGAANESEGAWCVVGGVGGLLVRVPPSEQAAHCRRGALLRLCTAVQLSACATTLSSLLHPP